MKMTLAQLRSAMTGNADPPEPDADDRPQGKKKTVKRGLFGKAKPKGGAYG